MSDVAMATALRQVITGLNAVVKQLEGDVPGDERTSRRIALMERFNVEPGDGLSREEASQVFLENGYNPRSFGGWVRRGLIARDDDCRYLTPQGRALLAELLAARQA